MPHHETDTRAEELYAGIRTFLASIAERRSRIPADEAESLVHDVFAAYLQRRPAVRNLRAWFVGAICHACRHYWRKHARFVRLEDAQEDAQECSVLYEARDIAQLTAHRLLRGLRPREVLVLWLRFGEGRTIHDLGVQIGLTRSGAEKVLRRALRRLSEQAVVAAPENRRSIVRVGAEVCLPQTRMSGNGRWIGRLCDRAAALGRDGDTDERTSLSFPASDIPVIAACRSPSISARLRIPRLRHGQRRDAEVPVM